MRLRGRRVSQWWLLLFIPILIISAPSLLIGFFAANNLAGAIFGPPAIWNRTWRTPANSDLVGTYVESERHWSEDVPHASATLVLDGNGAMTVRDLPSEFGTETCIITGTGQWRLSSRSGEQRIDLIYTADKAIVNVCRSGYYGGPELAGHSKPYSLYWVLGDPDSGTGLWLTRTP